LWYESCSCYSHQFDAESTILVAAVVSLSCNLCIEVPCDDDALDAASNLLDIRCQLVEEVFPFLFLGAVDGGVDVYDCSFVNDNGGGSGVRGGGGCLSWQNRSIVDRDSSFLRRRSAVCYRESRNVGNVDLARKVSLLDQDDGGGLGFLVNCRPQPICLVPQAVCIPTPYLLLIDICILPPSPSLPYTCQRRLYQPEAGFPFGRHGFMKEVEG
jgi:hypothetical protein